MGKKKDSVLFIYTSQKKLTKKKILKNKKVINFLRKIFIGKMKRIFKKKKYKIS